MAAPYSQKHISSATTTAVLAKTGMVHAIVVNTAVGTVTLNDALGTIAVLGATVLGTQLFDVNCVGKIEVVTSGAADLTVVYREG